jgi:proteasome lid subunit RPN8/RPN11
VDVTVADSVDRDISAIQCDDWPIRPLKTFLGFREPHFQVVFSQSALDALHLHGQGCNDMEVCGVLVGTGYRDDNGPYLLVEHSIRGNGARTKSTNVTFTGETWAYIQTIMDRDHADKKMVGWYHTHPGFGIFLSDMDVFICENFFNIPWQIAFVYDPIGGDEGNFIWRAGHPTREPVLIEDDITPLSASIPLISTAEAMSTTDQPENSIAPDEKIIELLVRVRRLERRQKQLATAVVFLAAFVIMWIWYFQPLPVASTTPQKPAGPSTQPAPKQLTTDNGPLTKGH